MKTIHAIYENGVFRPTEPVALPEQTSVEFEPRVVAQGPAPDTGKQPLLACDLLQSGLVGIWAERTDIDNNHEFARGLRDQAQTRRHER